MPTQLSEEQLVRLGRAIYTATKALEIQIKFTNQALVDKGISAAYKLPDRPVVDAAIVSLKKQLNRHVSAYGVHQADIDCYKVTAWLGMLLYKNAGNEPTFQVLDVVGVLNAELRKDNRFLPLEVMGKIATMAKNDGHQQNDDLAIGMNGLYMIFRACYKLSVTSPSNP